LRDFTYAAAFLDPDSVLDPFLAVGVEGVGDGLLGGKGCNELRLQLLNHLERVHGDVLEWTHDGTLDINLAGDN
jgi:hypothetical protein